MKSLYRSQVKKKNVFVWLEKCIETFLNEAEMEKEILLVVRFVVLVKVFKNSAIF